MKKTILSELFLAINPVKHGKNAIPVYSTALSSILLNI